jgi:predicted cobalt transporter CbtA
VSRTATAALYVAAIVVLVVGVDLLFFRHHFWERLAANVGIVLIVLAFYFRFARRS